MHPHAVRRIRSILLAAVLLPVATYALDSLLWHVRNARGQGTDEVVVTQVTAAQLKRSREEYYVDSAITITCARSLFPPLTAAGWLPPCWYIRRNQIVVNRV